MKKLILSVLVLGCSITLMAQTARKPATKTTTKAPAKTTTTASTVSMKSPLDSFSYALGLSIANFYKEQGVKNINNALVMKALNDSETREIQIIVLTSCDGKPPIKCEIGKQYFLNDGVLTCR